jgi:hypothetical protein
MEHGRIPNRRQMYTRKATYTKLNSRISPLKHIGQTGHMFSPCGGGLEYLHHSPASCKRRQKGNLVSNETVKFGLKFCLDLDLTVSTARYKSILSSERAPCITIQVNVKSKGNLKSGHGPHRAARHLDVLAYCPSVANSTPLRSHISYMNQRYLIRAALRKETSHVKTP